MRRAATVGAAAVALLTLAGCAGVPFAPGPTFLPSPTPGPAASTSPATSPSPGGGTGPADGPTVVLDAVLTSPDGQRARLQAELGFGTPARSSTVDGRVVVRVPVPSTVTVTNLERRIDVGAGQAGFTFLAGYPGDGAVCAAARPRPERVGDLCWVGLGGAAPRLAGGGYLALQPLERRVLEPAGTTRVRLVGPTGTRPAAARALELELARALGRPRLVIAIVSDRSGLDAVFRTPCGQPAPAPSTQAGGGGFRIVSGVYRLVAATGPVRCAQLPVLSR